jgi:hypothetical protein
MRNKLRRTRAGRGVTPAPRWLGWATLAFAPLSLAAQGVAPATSRVVVFTARDYAFEIPDSVRAGLTTVVVRNTGKEDHEAILVRLHGNESLGELLRAITTSDDVASMPAWATAVGGPGEAVPGDESNATLLLVPGHYVVLCGVPAPDGKSHFMKGMMRDLTVIPPSRRASMPESDVSIIMVDDTFQVTGTLSAGQHTFRVTNAGKQGHMMEMVRLVPGKTANDVATWDPASKTPEPIDWSGGVSYMSPGRSAYFSARLQPGVYALICFIDDAKDHKPHFMHGMQKQFTVRPA